MQEFKNLIEVTRYFSDEAICRKHLEDMRWNGTVCCPHCGSVKVYRFKDGKLFKCAEKECNKKFTVTVGTIFENTKVPLSKWFIAFYIFSSHKRGISSVQLAKDISVKQQTAWFMLHRIREAFREKSEFVFDGVVEIDETYVGGKVSNWSNSKRAKYAADKTSWQDTKSTVFTIVERGGKKVYMQIIPSGHKETIKPIIKKKIRSGSTINTDSAVVYAHLGKEFYYEHKVVDHDVNEYGRDDATTNTVEGVFSHFKRMIYGTYFQVSRKHLSRYCDESSFRYEQRTMEESERMNFSLGNCESRLSYEDLTGVKKVRFVPKEKKDESQESKEEI